MKTRLRLALLILTGVAAGTAAFAQDEGQLQSDFRREGEEIRNHCSAFKKIFGCLQELGTGEPLHITAGSIAPQNGTGFGGAFVFDKNFGRNWRTNTNADGVVSTNGSWRTGIYMKLVRTAIQAPIVVTTRPAAGSAPPPAPVLKAVPEFNFYVQATS